MPRLHSDILLPPTMVGKRTLRSGGSNGGGQATSTVAETSQIRFDQAEATADVQDPSVDFLVGKVDWPGNSRTGNGPSKAGRL